MQRYRLPNSNLEISRLGLGGCPLGGHGWGPVERSALLSAVRRALDCGVNFFDTADIYGFGESERVLSEALGEDRHNAVIASKFGVRRDSTRTFYDASPQWLSQAVNDSLRRLRLESIPLYYLHWPDSKTPLEETIGALARLREAGKIQAIGLSNLSIEQVVIARRVAPISVLQVQYSLLDRAKAEVLLKEDCCSDLPLVTWGSLSQGLLTGKFHSESRFSPGDRRLRYPAFQGKSFDSNLAVVDRLAQEARRLGCRTSQLAVRWLLDTPGVGAVLFGAKSTEQVDEIIGTDSIGELDIETHARIASFTERQSVAA